MFAQIIDGCDYGFCLLVCGKQSPQRGVGYRFCGDLFEGLGQIGAIQVCGEEIPLGDGEGPIGNGSLNVTREFQEW
jgi:hypothetical protein